MQKTTFTKTTTVIIYISLIVYAYALFVLLFSRSGAHFGGLSLWEYVQYSSNFVPFKTVWEYITAMHTGRMNIGTPIRNLLGNLLMFAPLGFYLPFISAKLKKTANFALFTALLILVIEVVQVFTRRGSLDIDDFILNMCGALLGLLLCKHTPIRKLFESHVS